MRSFLSIFFSVLLCPLFAQNDIPIGTWRTHFSYVEGKDLSINGQLIYAASGNGFFELDLDEFSTRTLSKIDGFSDVNVSALGSENGITVIGYSNGNIDLLEDQEIQNISAVVDAQLDNPKTYNHVYFHEGLAYLSSDFGLVILDMFQKEIRESLTSIGDGGTELRVSNSVILGDSIFLACEEGVIAANLNTNLLDFNNWRRFGAADGLPPGSISAVSVLDNQVVAGVDNQGIFSLQSGNWTITAFTTTQNFNSITSADNDLLVCLSDQLFRVSSGFVSVEFSDEKIVQPRRAYESGTDIWLADGMNGLVRVGSAGSESFIPSGPYSPISVRLDYANGSIYSFPPFRNEDGDPLRTDSGFDRFTEGLWEMYNNTGQESAIEIAPVMDLSGVVWESGLQYTFSSYGYGLMLWDGTTDFQIFDENSPGSTLINSDPPGRNTFITDVYPSAGNLYALNYDTDSPLHIKDREGNWTAFTPTLGQAKFPMQVLNVFGDIWMRIDNQRGGGIVVYDPETSSQVFISENAGFGNLPSQDINDIELDQDGQVWVGTDLGIVFYPNPLLVLEGDPDASVPIFENRPLLRDERITAIEIDGGNRIWIGTDRGLWLFDEGIDEQIYNFTIENSPLISNRILDIEIDEESGEVFIATQSGIQSFRGTATRGGGTHSNVKIFPNPVRKNFQGQVGISGLVNNAIVKITDVSGKLVKEVRASGGTAVWDVADFSGVRVRTGIYLIYSASADGEETFVGKIAVLE